MIRRALLLLGSVLTLLLLPEAAAVASCANPPSPSPYAFTGTVTQVRSHGLIASVRTEDGENVEVRGGRAAGAASSEARQYAVGGVYEFHPTNSASPFNDDACTATRQLSGPKYDPSMDSGGVPFGPPLFFAAILFGLLIAIPWLVRRGRRPPTAGQDAGTDRQ